MIKTLDLSIKHEEVKGAYDAVNLEALCPAGNTPSTISVHCLSREYSKRETQNEIFYEIAEEKTMVYEFDYCKPGLKRAARYKGDFQERDFKWAGNLLKEYFPREYLPSDARRKEKTSTLKRKMKRRAHQLVKKIIEQLNENYQKAGTKEKDNYEFFIKVLRKVNVNPDN